MKILFKSLIILAISMNYSFAKDKFMFECNAIEYLGFNIKDGKTETSHSSDKGKIKLELTNEKNYILSGKDKAEIILLSISEQGTIYFIEKTEVGNINLLTLFRTGELLISKSFDLMGIVKTSNMTYWNCTEIK